MDIIAYTLAQTSAKKLVASAASGIDGITFDDDNNLVFALKDGTSLSLAVPLPEDGASITGVTIDENNHLICTLSDGTSIDAGAIEVSGDVTTDYDKLLNTPVKNVAGTAETPIILNTLDYGSYVLSGSYLYTSKDSTVKTISYKTNIQIYQDAVSQRKVAKFENIEDSIFYIYTIYFNDDETCLQDKLQISNSSQTGVLFVKEADLPATGVEGILYVTEQNLYQYTTDGYVNMNSLQWGTF